jgi:hypothetical protein
MKRGKGRKIKERKVSFVNYGNCAPFTAEMRRRRSKKPIKVLTRISRYEHEFFKLRAAGKPREGRVIPTRPAILFVSWTAPAKRSGDGAFARTRGPRAFEDRCPHESSVALCFPPHSMTLRARIAAGSQTSRSSFAGMTASEILNMA